MAGVVSVTRKSDSLTSGVDEQGRRFYALTYTVKTDSRYVGPVAVLAATPAYGSAWTFGGTTSQGEYTEVDTGALLRDKQVKHITNAGNVLWEVACRWSSEPIDPDSPADPDASPLDDAPIVRWFTTRYEATPKYDLDGKPYANSVGILAGTFGVAQVVLDDARLGVQVTKNYASFDTSFIEPYCNAINSDAFLGRPARTLKLSEITAVNQERNGVAYVEAALLFEYRPLPGWQPRVMNYGPGYLDSAGEYHTEGSTVPYYHDAQGHLLNGHGVKPSDPNQITYSDFRGYREIAFSTLNIF